MGNLTEFAKEELARLGGQGDEMQQMMNKQIMEIVETFSNHGHSGFSGQYALNLLKNLLDFKPITPLTGEDDEWAPTFDGNGEQNRRCSTIFRKIGDNSTAYDIDGKIFSDDGGESWYTCKDSFVPVIFPYVVPSEPERIILTKE